VLPAAWRDLLRNGIYLDKLLPLVQDGCGLYRTKRSQDKYTVELTQQTALLRTEFLAVIAADADTGGAYTRRSSLPRIRLAENAPDPDIIRMNASSASPTIAATDPIVNPDVDDTTGERVDADDDSVLLPDSLDRWGREFTAR
jgi:hypothetical protein